MTSERKGGASERSIDAPTSMLESRNKVSNRSWLGPLTLAPQLASGCVEASLHLLDHLVDAETRRTLARRIVLERLKELADRRQHAVQDPGVGHEPVVIRVRGNIGPLVGVGAQIEHLRKAQLGEGFGPNAHGAGCPLFLEYHFPV